MIKIWNFNKEFECLIKISNIYKKGYIYSASIFSQDNNYYIVTSNYNIYNCEKIKLYNLEGKKIREINESNEKTYFLDIFYNENKDINYIITDNEKYVKSFNYNNNKLYYKYIDKDDSSEHYSFIIKIIKNIIELFECSQNGYLRIWNFDTGELLKKFKVVSMGLYDICDWIDNFIYIGCEDKTIISFDIETEEKKILKGHNGIVSCIKKIFHPNFGACLISQGKGSDQIKIWVK